MSRRTVLPYATATSGQPLPYLPLPIARTGVPADEDRTALPIFQTGTGARAHRAGLRRRCTAARYSNRHASGHTTGNLCGLLNAC